MKTITLTVNLTFDSDISDDREIQEIAHNVINAIYHEAEEVGISPIDSDTCLKLIEVKEQFTNYSAAQEI